ncbi:extracellular calcium-sensing receptor-like [Spea bombifrons]|uniref:extracellular calcium-sensing receptor-like n=1 Tax=Spea bombifrons TaxID=233779 RepID=UPI00234B98FB|nr:extracellular calcium-sensing receptor-like [Spea bombifrons]
MKLQLSASMIVVEINRSAYCVGSIRDPHPGTPSKPMLEMTGACQPGACYLGPRPKRQNPQTTKADVIYEDYKQAERTSISPEKAMHLHGEWLVALFYKTLWHLMLYYLVPAYYSPSHSCFLDAPDVLGILQTGDIRIGAILPLHLEKVYSKVLYTEKPRPILCKGLSLGSYLQMQVVKYATEEINNNPHILPNITLGFQIYDSCTVLQRELEGTLWMITAQNKAIPNFRCQGRDQLAAVIGHSASTYSILLAHILGLNRYPQVSHFSTSSILSDRTQFPSFFRTVPSDAFQSKGVAQLVLHFGWTWVGLVAMANDYGQQGIQVIKQELLKSGACVEFTEYLHNTLPYYNIPHVARVIKESTAKAIVVVSTDLGFMPLVNEIIKQNVTEKIWVASEGWATSEFLSSNQYSRFLLGTIGFAFHSWTIPGFHEFIYHRSLSEPPGEAWYRMLLEEQLGCVLPGFQNFTFSRVKPSRNCTARDRMDNFQISVGNISNVAMLSNLYSAVHVIGNALHDLNSCEMGRGPFSNGSCPNLWNFQPWQLVHYMSKVKVRLPSGRQMFFDANGDPPPLYDIVNWQLNPDSTMRAVKVGSYGPSAPGEKVLIINTSALQWTTQQVPTSMCSRSCPPGFRRSLIRGKPTCCFQCIPCPPGEISNRTDSLECLRCLWNEWPNQRKDSCLQKTIQFLSYEEPLGAALASISVSSSMIPVAVLGLFIYYRATPAVRANNYTLSCLLLISLALCFLCSLAFIGYPRLQKCRLRQVTFGMVFAFCVSCLLAKTIMVVIAFRATKPNSDLRKWASPHVSYMVMGLCVFLQLLIGIAWLTISPPFPEYNFKSQPEVLIIECNEGSPTAFWGTLGYLGFLAIISFIVAFLARRLPDSFNETKFITFSMLAFLTVWVSYIPASLSTSGKYTVAMEIFAIQSSSWAMLGCMFAPKCFIILFHPHKNSKKHLLEQTKKKLKRAS